MSDLLTPAPSFATPPVVTLPWADAFFAGAIASQHLAHAYILKGKALGAMYNLTLQVAKVVNCLHRPEMAEAVGSLSLEQLACGQCTNCRWAMQNSHPAVLTISRLTYQVSDNGGDLSPEQLEKLAKKASQPTQIKAEQIDRLLSQLGLSSEYTRVIIFTDAEELPASMPSDVVPPFEWRNLEMNADKSFHIRPLERKLFNHASANRFLKTLEEPLPRTLFFFIAETEEQLLETIVSRCQVVPCAPGQAMDTALTIPAEFAAFLEDWSIRLQRGGDAYAASSELSTFVDDAGFNMLQALALMQDYWRQRFMNEAVDEAAFAQYRTTQQALNEAVRMLTSKTNENQVLLNLCLQLSSLKT